MPNNYQFLDAYGSVLTAESSIIGSAHRPIVNVGSVLFAVPVVFSGNTSVSGTVGASIIGAVNTNPGSVLVLNPVSTLAVNPNPASVQVLNPVSVLAVTQSGAWSASLVGTIPGSVVGFQGGTWRPSTIGQVTRNDAVASFLGADLTYRPVAGDSAGRLLTKAFAPEESRIEGYASVVSTSVTTLVAAAGAGLRNYITDIILANTGATTTLVTFRSGGGTSVLGYSIAPTAGGSNIIGLTTPFRTLANETFDFQATTSSSILFATVKGFKAP